MFLKKLISFMLLVTFISTTLGQNYVWAVRNDDLFHTLRPPNTTPVNEENILTEESKQKEKSKYDWSRMKTAEFWKGLFSKDISKYPQRLKLDDIGRHILGFTLIFLTFTIAELYKTGSANPIYSVLFGLGVAVFYVFSNTFFHWTTDKIPQWEGNKGLKYNLGLFFNKEFLNPGKHGRAMLTKGGATGLFMFLSFGVFYIFNPLLISAVWAWVFATTLFLGAYGGSYDGWMRSKQYPESNILRFEYMRNYFMTFCSILATLHFSPDPVIYLIIRRLIGDVTAALVDLKGAFTTYLISRGVKISLPFSKKIKIYENGQKKPRELDLNAFNSNWVYQKAELMIYLIKRLEKFKGQNSSGIESMLEKLAQFESASITDNDQQSAQWRDLLGEALNKELENELKVELETKFGFDIGKKEGLQQFAEKVLESVQTFSLKNENIRKIWAANIIDTDMEQAGQLRKRFALDCFLTKPVEEKWEKMLEYAQFGRQPVEIVIIDEEEARQSKVVSEEIIMAEGVFADTDTGCVIIVNKKWDNPLELLLKLERARAKLEMFADVSEKIAGILAENNKKEEFSKYLATYHQQWYRYKSDPFYSLERSLLEGRRQKLAFQYAKEFVGSEKNFPKKGKLNLKCLGILEDCCLVPEAFPKDSVLKLIKTDSYILYRYFLEFIKFVRLKDPRTGHPLSNAESEKFLDDFIVFCSAKNELGKDSWQSLTDYTKSLVDRNKMSRKERFIGWFNAKILIPKKVVTVATILLIAAHLLINAGPPFSIFALVTVMGIIMDKSSSPNKNFPFLKSLLTNKKHYFVPAGSV